jgi:hypothetical protein
MAPGQVEIYRGKSLEPATLAEWEGFIRNDAEVPWFHCDPLVLAHRIGESGRERELLVAILRQDGRIQALAPLLVEQSHLSLKLSVVTLARYPVRMARLVGPGFLYGRGVDCADAARHLLQALAREGLPLSLEELIVPGPEHALLSGEEGRAMGFRFVVTREEKVRRLRLQIDHEKYLSDLGTKQRNNMKRMLRGLDEGKDPQGAAWAPELERIVSPSDVQRFLDDLDAIFKNTWQAKTKGYVVRNGPKDVAFLTAVAERGWLRSYLLRVQGKPVAFVLGYQYGGTFLHDETGYAIEHRDTRPGIYLNHMLVADLFAENRPAVLDFGFGENEYKDAIGNEESDVISAFAVSKPQHQYFLRSQQVLNRVYDYTRGELVRRGWDVRVRNLLKRRA